MELRNDLFLFINVTTTDVSNVALVCTKTAADLRYFFCIHGRMLLLFTETTAKAVKQYTIFPGKWKLKK